MMKKPPASTAKLYYILTKPCPTCQGTGWVCRVHSLRPMDHDACGRIGKPCRCNPEKLPARNDDLGL
jgi:hypothetical protein